MSYLEHYGEGVERRVRTLKRALLCAAALLVGGAALLFTFHNWRQERQARRFFELLHAGDYAAAHALWAPTESDRRAYPFEAFLDDWGPKSGRDGFHIAKSRSCGSGVVLTIDSPGAGRQRLWVQRDTLTIGYPPPAELLPKICNF